VLLVVEGGAEEAAAAAGATRDLTGGAVARAALATRPAWPATALRIDGSGTVQRVLALTRPAPARLLRRLVGPILVGAVTLLVAGVATNAFLHLARAWL
jgi:hypothetical protein